MMVRKEETEGVTEEKKEKYHYLTGYQKIILWMVIITGVMIVFLPELMEFYKTLPLGYVNPKTSNLSRLEFLKVSISILSPVLTYMAFSNTTKLQKANDEQRRIEKEEAIRKENYQMMHTDFYKLLELFTKIQKDEEVRKHLPLMAESIETGIDPYGEEHSEFDPFAYIGHYFRIVNRILKILNLRLDEGAIKPEEYHMFIGIFRTQISKTEFIVLLYNSLYAWTGKGLGIQMIGSGFFDDVRPENSLNLPNDKEAIFKVQELVKKFDFNEENIEYRKTNQMSLKAMKESLMDSYRVIESEPTKIEIKT